MQEAQEEAQKIVDNADRQRKAVEKRIKQNFEWKFEELSRALQMKLSDN
jgi:F0F1-type ATP synthase membrane subunit b/b'